MLTINNTLDGYLKDVEIKGNTIQDTSNLADIRSVGDKVEGQELYEIPVLSCGKNLFSLSEEEKSIANNGYKLPIKDGINYMFSSLDNARYDLMKYKGDSHTGWYVADNYNAIVRIKLDENHDNVRIRFKDNASFKRFQLEEGTVATPYEPYVEDKLTILSPTPLERVGGVADRIIEKDGVWGVEKNVETVLLDGSENWTKYTTKGNVDLWILTMVLPFRADPWANNNAISNYNICKYAVAFTSSDWTEYINAIGFVGGYHSTNSNHVVGIFLDRSINIKDKLSKNPILLKYQTTQPQFIPLTHDQQVKLRTFANKTNISFLTEIEGTIKAQVPKSLGATVNTHTEQIGNLNKELDRVKKLEESTVSTVETESDFTTVEQTSNGYFEDVKLEGKTLVNLSSKQNLKLTGNGTSIITTMSTLLKPIVEGVDYYISLTVPSDLPSQNCDVRIYENNGDSLETIFTREELYNNRGKRISKKIRLNTSLGKIATHIRLVVFACTDTFSINDILILEGDHTQNPPSFFEGLKSVGQSASEDGADEIVVSSVKGDGNLVDFIEIGGTNGNDGEFGVDYNNKIYFRSNYINVQGLNTISYSFSHKDKTLKSPLYCFYDKNKKGIPPYRRGVTVDVPSSAKYVRFEGQLNDVSDVTPYINDIDLMISAGDVPKPYTPHQSDKKRLLYYNDETQSWEKPILREWDSIEKHADGKYYYHQRSGEVILDGSGIWAVSSVNENTIQFVRSLSNVTGNSILICDKFKYNGDGSDTERINYTASLYLNVLKSKLSTQDVQGFKQWLQANNVTVVYQLAQEKVYECTNIDLITYTNETSYIINCGAIVPKTTLKVHNNISNVVSLLQKKVSLLESNVTSYMITQNRLQLSSTYSADSVTFKVDYAVCSENRSQENYNTDLYNLILNNILVGKDNYDYDHMFNIIMDYASWSQISWGQFDILVGIMDLQHNPPIEPPIEEVPCETPEE